MLRSILAVVAGYIVLLLVTNIPTLLFFGVIRPLLADGSGVPFLSANVFSITVVVRSVSATLGGYVSATLAPSRPIVHALVLGAVIVAIDLLIAAVMRGNQPPWYRPLMSGGGAGFAVFGACILVRRRRRPS